VKRNYFIVGLIFLIFFVISILTNILGPLIPDFINGFDLSLTMAAFMPFAFFVAYGIMSIPSGMLVERYQEKTVLLVSFILAFCGSFLFASFSYYLVGLFSLFLIGTGMAMLQVAINPLLRTAGGEENFAFFSVMAQLIFGGAAYIAPQIYTYLVINLDSVTQKSDFIIPEINIIGGGANSNVWCQIFADVLNRKIKQVENPIQANARGAAFIASVGLGYIEWDHIPKHIKFSNIFTPNPENRKKAQDNPLSKKY